MTFKTVMWNCHRSDWLKIQPHLNLTELDSVREICTAIGQKSEIVTWAFNQ